MIFVVLMLAKIIIDPSDEAGTSSSTPTPAGELDATSTSTVDYEVVTTNYGWNTPESASFSRRILSGEFFNATLAHPRYNASAWADLEANPDPNRRIVAFLDVDTCIEANYPVYGDWANWKKNLEANHMEPTKSAVAIASRSCQYLKRAATSPALTAHPDSRLVVFDCAGVEKVRLRHVCGHDPNVFRNDRVVVGYYSVERAGMRPFADVGMTPPAIKPINLTASERDDVRSCRERKYLFSFQGKSGFGRENLLKFRNDTDMYVRLFDERDSYAKDIRKDGFASGKVEDSNNFKGIMKDSVFAGSPRGDLLFSYRFSEILSAGAIPVVYADGWLPPFNEHVVDWSKCAVFIPESDYDKTGEILRAIPEEKRCEMQRCALRVWDQYAAARAGWVRAFVAVALSTSAFGISALDV